MKSDQILIVDDEENIRFVLRGMLEAEGYTVVSEDTGESAVQRLQKSAAGEFSAIISDLRLPGCDGMHVLSAAMKLQPEVPLIMITAFGSVQAAVSAMKKGAFDFVSKPFDRNDLITVTRKAVATHKIRKGELSSVKDSRMLIGRTQRMREVFNLIMKVADSPTTVLITGESGTGKELVAKEIHARSSRAANALIRVNCSAIPSSLIESELFGYEKGAFTGAVGAKPGRFELAHEGTLFLDEVADMPMEMQVKLLRVLQEGEIERVGGVRTTRVDVRVIAATNKDLQKEIAEERFREDLFYRLNVVPIHLPALCERREDIPELVQNILAQLQLKLGRARSVSEECLQRLVQFSWPGNIRQLENVLERAVLLAEKGEIHVGDLPEELNVVGALPAGQSVDLFELKQMKEVVRQQSQELEKEFIRRALEETGGNITQAAKKLNLSRKGLQIKLKELDLKIMGTNPAGASPD